MAGMTKKERIKKRSDARISLGRAVRAPKVFKAERHDGAAKFSHNMKKYGCLDSWDIALEFFENLEERDRQYHELLLENTPVKPYFDIEWIQSDYPNADPEFVLSDIKNAIRNAMGHNWNLPAPDEVIFVATCHRQVAAGFKYSFHVVVSTSPVVYFSTQKHASVFCRQVAEGITGTDAVPAMIDTGVYKSTQNFRLLGHYKETDPRNCFVIHGIHPHDRWARTVGEQTIETVRFDKSTSEQYCNDATVTMHQRGNGVGYVEMEWLKHTDRKIPYLVTHLGANPRLLPTTEPCSDRLKLTHIELANEETMSFIDEKVRELHPTAHREPSDESTGFIQYNYEDRDEICFAKGLTHDSLGMFVFIQHGTIKIGCHSARCVDDASDKKILYELGSVPEPVIDEDLEEFEPVTKNEKTFKLPSQVIRDNILDEDAGMSVIFATAFRGRVKRISTGLYLWNGKLWEEDLAKLMPNLAAKVLPRILESFVKIYKDDDTASQVTIPSSHDEACLEACRAWCTKLKKGFTQTILELLTHDIYDRDFEAVCDVHPGYLSVANGMLNLTTLELRPARAQDNITRKLKTAFKANADYGIWDKFVWDITSSPEGNQRDVYEYLRWMIGYALQGNPKEKMFFFLLGEKGSNGKSLFLNTICGVLEDYANGAMDPSVVMDTGRGILSGGNHSSNIMAMKNKRIGVLGDTNESMTINSGQLKMFTGITDEITAREIYKKQEKFRPVFVPFICSNVQVKMDLKDDALYDRLALLVFEMTFKANPNLKNKYERQADSNLVKKFSECKEGILRWCAECAQMYNSMPAMKLPPKMQAFKDQYREVMNVYAKFVSDSFAVTGQPEDRVLKSDVFAQFKAFYADELGEREKPPSRAAVLKQLDRILTSAKVDGRQFYIGVVNQGE